MITQLLLLALANATVVITVTKSSLFKSFRNILPNTKIINFKKLFNCAYCLSHWTAPLLILYQYGLTLTFFDFIIKTLILIAITSIFAFVLLLYLHLLDKGN